MKKTCSVEECYAEAIGNGLCSMHYRRHKRTGDLTCKGTIETTRHPNTGKCLEPDCERDADSRGLCSLHYQRVMRTEGWTGKTCLHCDRPAWSRGMCAMHYSRVRFNGSPLRNGSTEVMRIPEEQICLVCEKPARVKGMCKKHYAQAWYREKADDLKIKRCLTSV